MKTLLWFWSAGHILCGIRQSTMRRALLSYVSPKWRRLILPSRWMWPGNIDCKINKELYAVSQFDSLRRLINATGLSDQVQGEFL